MGIDLDLFFDTDAILEKLVEEGHLSDPADGVTKQVLSRGEANLTRKQEYVFETFVKKVYLEMSCERCFTTIPNCELADAIDNGGYCSWCEHQRAKYF